jgi:hypothetical protein
MNETDKNLTKNAVKNTLEALISSTPALAVAWALAKSLYGNALELRQERALEFVEFIMNNPSAFKKDLLESVEFQDGFIESLENYIRIRLVLKRGIARNIFLGFANSDNKEQFSLERLNSTLRTITADAIQFLLFIQETLEPIQKSKTESEMNGIDRASTGNNYSRLSELVIKHFPLSSIFDEWLVANGKQDIQVMLNNVPNLSHPTITSSTGYILSNSEKSHFEESIVELQSLGILKGHSYTVSSGGINETRKYWDYTDFGKQFIAYLDIP